MVEELRRQEETDCDEDEGLDGDSIILPLYHYGQKRALIVLEEEGEDEGCQRFLIDLRRDATKSPSREKGS